MTQLDSPSVPEAPESTLTADERQELQRLRHEVAALRTARPPRAKFRWRSLLVGLMHGMAGSAALLVLAISQAASPVSGLLYVLLFGVGSMLGMGALSAVIAVPLAVSARSLSFANRALQGGVGAITIGIGAMTIYSATFTAP